MTLAEIIDQTATRFALTSSERRTLTEAVIAYVDDGQLAELPVAGALARKLGEVTLFRVVHRIVEQRLDASDNGAILNASAPPPGHAAPEATRGPRLFPAPTPPAKARYRCSACSLSGHNSRRCPLLSAGRA